MVQSTVFYLWNKPTRRRCIGDTFTKQKWTDLSSANTKNIKGTKQEKLEEVLAVWASQLNIQSGRATDEVFKEGAKMFASAVR